MSNIVNWNELGLHPERWMDWVHCRYDEWYVYFMIYNAEITFAFYQLFAIMAWYGYNNRVARKMHSGYYFSSLAVVFHLCGLVHVTDKLSMMYPYLKLFALTQPILNLAMLFLLIAGLKDVTKWHKLKTQSQVTQIGEDIKAELESAGFSPQAKDIIDRIINAK